MTLDGTKDAVDEAAERDVRRRTGTERIGQEKEETKRKTRRKKEEEKEQAPQQQRREDVRIGAARLYASGRKPGLESGAYRHSRIGDTLFRSLAFFFCARVPSFALPRQINTRKMRVAFERRRRPFPATARSDRACPHRPRRPIILRLESTKAKKCGKRMARRVWGAKDPHVLQFRTRRPSNRPADFDCAACQMPRCRNRRRVVDAQKDRKSRIAKNSRARFNFHVARKHITHR